MGSVICLHFFQEERSCENEKNGLLKYYVN